MANIEKLSKPKTVRTEDLKIKGNEKKLLAYLNKINTTAANGKK